MTRPARKRGVVRFVRATVTLDIQTRGMIDYMIDHGYDVNISALVRETVRRVYRDWQLRERLARAAGGRTAT